MTSAPEQKAPLSFAAIAEKKAEKPHLRCVQLEGHVVLKIAKHCRDNMPNLVTGQLLGLDVGQTQQVLEVTDCFPFPVRTDFPMCGVMFCPLILLMVLLT